MAGGSAGSSDANGAVGTPPPPFSPGEEAAISLGILFPIIAALAVALYLGKLRPPQWLSRRRTRANSVSLGRTKASSTRSRSIGETVHGNVRFSEAPELPAIAMVDWRANPLSRAQERV